MLEHLRAVVIALLINIVIGESNVSVPGGSKYGVFLKIFTFGSI